MNQVGIVICAVLLMAGRGYAGSAISSCDTGCTISLGRTAQADRSIIVGSRMEGTVRGINRLYCKSVVRLDAGCGAHDEAVGK